MDLTPNKVYSSTSAKEAVRVHKYRVDWCNVVWGKGHIPKHAFFVWLAFRGRFLTRDKLRLWGCIQNEDCVLCSDAREDLPHLFFGSPLSATVWKEGLRRCRTVGTDREVMEWNEKGRVIQEAKGGSFVARVRRIVFAATIYLLWQERNGRIFNNRVNDPIKKIEGQYVMLPGIGDSRGAMRTRLSVESGELMI